MHKKALVSRVSAFAALLFVAGLGMIANRTLGCVLIGLAAVLGWFVLVQFRWFPVLTRKYIHYPGHGLIVIATLILTLLTHAGKLDTRKDASQVALLNRTDEEILRLRNEYEFGFVLIAFSGEVETTKVKSYTDRIQADWDNSRAYMESGRVVIEVPRFRARGYPSGNIDLPQLRVSVPPNPGTPLPGIVLGDMKIQCECLETQPIGICAVIGFKRVKQAPR